MYPGASGQQKYYLQEHCVGWVFRENSVNEHSRNTDSVWACRDVLRKAKAYLELKLVREVKANMKCFSIFFSSKRKTRENMGLLLSGEIDLVTKDTEKNKAVRAFYILIFIGKTRPPKPTGKSRVRETYP